MAVALEVAGHRQPPPTLRSSPPCPSFLPNISPGRGVCTSFGCCKPPPQPAPAHASLAQSWTLSQLVVASRFSWGLRRNKRCYGCSRHSTTVVLATTSTGAEHFDISTAWCVSAKPSRAADITASCWSCSPRRGPQLADFHLCHYGSGVSSRRIAVFLRYQLR